MLSLAFRARSFAILAGFGTGILIDREPESRARDIKLVARQVLPRTLDPIRQRVGSFGFLVLHELDV